MSLENICQELPLSGEEVQLLWQICSTKVELNNIVTLNCVSSKEMQKLNLQYRDKDKPTNILTFNYDEQTSDIVLCLDIVKNEAEEQGRDLKEYSAYLVAHGILHVAGLTHNEDSDAEKMEALEQEILQESGILRR